MPVPPEWRDPPSHPGDLCDEQGVVTWPCPYPHEHPPEGARFPLAGYWVGNDHPLLEYWRKCGIFVPCLFKTAMRVQTWLHAPFPVGGWFRVEGLGEGNDG